MTYTEQLLDERWKVRRLEIVRLDGARCRGCGVSGFNAALQVHHLYYRWGLMAWEYPDDALATLCRDCHLRERFTFYPLDTARRSRDRNEKRRTLGLPGLSGSGEWIDEDGIALKQTEESEYEEEFAEAE